MTLILTFFLLIERILIWVFQTFPKSHLFLPLGGDNNKQFVIVFSFAFIFIQIIDLINQTSILLSIPT